MPVIVGSSGENVYEVIQHTKVENNQGIEFPLFNFIKLTEKTGFETIYADREGVFIPLTFENTGLKTSELEHRINRFFSGSKLPYNPSFSGSLYDFRKHLKELIIILIISLVLLYFILAAQFESLTLPLIILLEIPMDIGGSVLLLMVAGSSLNIMAAIGIIVMTGIIINDSILKMDTINRLWREEGFSLVEAIHEGGRRRIRPIIMTSVTTILALTPFLLGKGLGNALQQPLALAIMGGLGLGTVVSVWFIPLAYWFLYRKNEIIGLLDKK